MQLGEMLDYGDTVSTIKMGVLRLVFLTETETINDPQNAF